MKSNIKEFLIYVLVLCVILVPNVYAGCPLGADTTADVSGALKVLKILAPILCVVFSTVDAIKALTKGEIEAEGKKVAQRFAKRLAYTVILLFITTIVDAFMQLFDVWDSDGTCEFDESYSKVETTSSTSSNNTVVGSFEAYGASYSESSWSRYAEVKGNGCYYSIIGAGNLLVDYTDPDGKDNCDKSRMVTSCPTEVNHKLQCTLSLKK